MAHLSDTELILRYHQFSTDDIRAITKALHVNYSFPSIAFFLSMFHLIIR